MRLVLVILITATFSSTKAQVGPKIHGTWQNSQFGYQMTLMLNPDGSGEFDGELIRYVTRGGTLSITIGAETTDYTYSLQANSLILSGGDLDGKVTFTRNGVNSPDNTGTKKQVEPAYSSTSTTLIGLWSGNGEMIEFKADGKCVYLGNTFPYQVQQGHIILTTAQGNVSFSYVVKGTQLTMTANGQNVMYNKVSSATITNQNSGKGSIASELVGTWCYMNMNTNSQSSRCVTLNADGTYVYHSESSRSVNTESFSGGTASQGDDRGTWYVTGDRIYYNSPTSGQGSYRLEKRNHPKNVNDPMIVLDGEPYVTTTQRPPWR